MAKGKKPMTLNQTKIKELTYKAIQQTMLLTCAYLMDELDYSEDKICEIWEGVSRYSEAVMDKTISIDKVIEIINEQTGMNIKKVREYEGR